MFRYIVVKTCTPGDSPSAVNRNCTKELGSTKKIADAASEREEIASARTNAHEQGRAQKRAGRMTHTAGLRVASNYDSGCTGRQTGSALESPHCRKRKILGRSAKWLFQGAGSLHQLQRLDHAAAAKLVHDLRAFEHSRLLDHVCHSNCTIPDENSIARTCKVAMGLSYWA